MVDGFKPVLGKKIWIDKFDSDEMLSLINDLDHGAIIYAWLKVLALTANKTFSIKKVWVQI